ncbi:MAG TPA: hypothetical protein VIY48_01960 [Candidatus Paceibacterota bacterium]
MSDNDNGDAIRIKLPSWVGPVAGYFLKHGLVPVFAAGFFAVLMGWISSPLTRMADSHVVLDNRLDRIEAAQRRSEYINGAATEYQNMLLRTICHGIVPLQIQRQCEPKYLGYEENDLRK